ncbi:unnamed protein product [Nezara viridula]|nr:unnamed protein product [Nezara viridula]
MPVNLENTPGLPNIPTNVTISKSLDLSTMLVDWVHPGESMFIVETKEASGPWQTAHKTPRLSHPVKISIQSGVEYVARVAAVNDLGSKGFSIPSNPFTLHLEAKPPEMPENLSFKGVLKNGSVSGLFSWQLPRSDQHISRYLVVWTQRIADEKAPLNKGSKEVHRKTIPHGSQYVITGLEKNCEYNVVVKEISDMKAYLLLFIIISSTIVTESARGGGGGRMGGKGRGGRRNTYGSRMPILIRHRNPASASYYEHKDGARIVKASHFELDYMLGRKITFFCMAQGYPRPQITWFKDGIELYAHKYFQVMKREVVVLILLLLISSSFGQRRGGARGGRRTKSRTQLGLPVTGKYRDPESDQYYNNNNVHEWRMGKDKVKSKLEIDPATQMDAGVYECTADNMYSIDRRSFKTDFSIAFD